MKLSLALISLSALLLTGNLQAGAIQAYAGAVGGSIGVGVPGGCTVYNTPSALSAFAFNIPFIPSAGIGACGYSGGQQDNSSPTGPVTASQDTNATYNDATTFTADVDARASSGDLGVSIVTSRNSSSGGTDVGTAAAAARMTELHTIDSAGLAGSAGTVVYAFTLDGTATSTGVTNTVLRLAYNGGAIMFNTSITGNSVPFLVFTPVAGGWTTYTGGLTGSATYATAAIPMVFGTPFELDVALLLAINPANGDGNASFYNSAHLSGITVRNNQGQIVSDFLVQADTGARYDASGLIPSGPGGEVPEPATALLLSAGLALLGIARRRC